MTSREVRATPGAVTPGEPVDVVVVGAGPTGRAAATSCAEAGLQTVLIDARPFERWGHTYGAWADELPPGRDHVTARTWTDVRVRTDAGEERLARRYVLLDNDRLQDQLRRRFEAVGGGHVTGRVRGLRTSVDGATVAYDDGDSGRTLHQRARAVVDASGHRPVLVQPGGSGPPPLQTAFGWFGQWESAPATAGAMTFMDFSTAGLSAADRRHDAPPTFLYAMDLGGGHWLAEETSLAARPAVTMSTLERRLRDRLTARGALPISVDAVERVVFPMGVAVPDLRQPVVGFGAAAGMVHPATGFQVARSLRTAPMLAAALAEAIGSGAGPAATARAGWSAVWPADALKQRALQLMGLTALLRMDSATLQRFFEAFFRLEGPDWAAFVSGARDAAEFRRVMTAVFRQAPMDVRVRLAAAAVRRPALAAGGFGYLPASSR